MPIINKDGLPLIEFGPITDVWISGADHVEILGSVFRTVYFKWQRIDGLYRRVAAEFATVREIGRDRDTNPRTWNVPIVEMCGATSRPMSNHAH